MFPQNTFDMSTLNQLDSYSPDMFGSLNYGFNPYAVNQYATLHNQTSLSPLRQDTFGGRNTYYCEDKEGSHKNITMKQVLFTLGAFAAVVLGVKHYTSKLGSKITSLFNKELRKLSKEIRRTRRDTRAVKRQLSKTNQLLREQKALNNERTRLDKTRKKLTDAQNKLNK